MATDFHQSWRRWWGRGEVLHFSYTVADTSWISKSLSLHRHQLAKGLPLILFTGGPGSDKAAHCKKLIGRFPHMTHVSVAELIGLAIDNPKWHKVFEDLDKGELAPTVSDIFPFFFLLGRALGSQMEESVFESRSWRAPAVKLSSSPLIWIYGSNISTLPKCY